MEVPSSASWMHGLILNLEVLNLQTGCISLVYLTAAALQQQVDSVSVARTD